MGKFTFVGDSPRTFPGHGLEVEPGEVVDADTNPDPLFFEPATKKKAAAAAEPEE